MSPTIRLLGPGDASLLDRVAPEVFDNPIDPRRTAEFLVDGRHHLAVAFDGDVVVGMASAVHHVHPDKPPELWIYEVGVAPPYRGQGVGRRLLQALFERGREPGCLWPGSAPSDRARRPDASTRRWAVSKRQKTSSWSSSG
jgi:GNAT superfamily N-acetyltransferase